MMCKVSPLKQPAASGSPGELPAGAQLRVVRRWIRGCSKAPRRSKAPKKEYLAQTTVGIPYVEAQSHHGICTWTLLGRDRVVARWA